MPGVLEDKDRIFTNLYGLQDWRLEAAKRRGAWNATVEMLQMDRRLDLRPDQELGPARPRRRRLRHRAEVDLHAQGQSTRPGRTTWWSTPTNPSPAPARTGRSCGTTRTSSSRAA